MEQPTSQPARPSNSLRPALIGFAVVLVCGLCVLIVVGGLYLSGGLNNLLALFSTKPLAAAIAPAQSPMFFAMDADLSQAANFKRISDIYKSAQTQKSTNDFKKQFKDSTNLDFDADVAPWIGPEIAVFLTDTQGLSTGSQFSSAKPNLVIAIGTRDQKKSEAAIQKAFASRQPTQETYKNVQITTAANYGSAAVVRNFVVLGMTTEAVHAAIDASTAGGAATIAQNDAYKSVVSKLPSSRVATFYLDPAAVTQLANQSAVGIQPQGLEQLAMYRGMGGALSFTPDGIQMDVVMAFDQTKLAGCMKTLMQQAPNAGQVLKSIPANAYFAATGSNVKGAWDCSQSQMTADAKAQLQTVFDQAQKETGLDINQDILGWMTGEFGLAITPAKPMSAGAPGVGILALFEAKDKTLINSKMDKIAGVVTQQGLQFQDQTINGAPFKVVTLGLAPDSPGAGYGFLGSYLVLGGPLDVLGNAVDAPKNSLADDGNFKKVQNALPAKNSGYVYVSVAGIDQMVGGMLSGTALTSYQADVQPWLKPLKAVGLASESGRTDAGHVVLFAYINDQ